MNLGNTGQPPSCSFDGPAQEKLTGKVLGDVGDNLGNENKTSSRGQVQGQLCSLMARELYDLHFCPSY